MAHSTLNELWRRTQPGMIVGVHSIRNIQRTGKRKHDHDDQAIKIKPKYDDQQRHVQNKRNIVTNNNQAHNKSNPGTVRITKYFVRDDQARADIPHIESLPERRPKRVSLYKNQVSDEDHVATPDTILIYIQWLIEDITGLGLGPTARFCDPTPMRCGIDNSDSLQWPHSEPIFLNPPFSGTNAQFWMREAVKFYEQRDQSVIFLAKTDAMSTDYWKQLVYPNASKFIHLKNNIPYSGYTTVPRFRTVLVVFDRAKEGKNMKGVSTISEDVLKWRKRIGNVKLRKLNIRMKQHRQLN